MSTTTVRLTEDLKRRVASAAETSGTTAHAFILEAIADKTEQVERQAAFHAEADRRMANMKANGKSVAWGDVRKYLVERAAGRKATARPRSRKL